MDNKNRILLIIDPQNDFVDQKKGTLSVKNADEVMGDLARYIQQHGDEYSAFVVSCDFHPFNHCSFKGNKDIHENEGQWPVHCVQNSWGAAIYQPIMDVLGEMSQKGKEITFIQKGTDPSMEEYSAFSNPANVIKLCDIQEKHNVVQIDVCGIAGDYCLLQSLCSLHAEQFNEELFVLTEFCPSIDNGSTLMNFLKDNNIKHTLG